MIPDTLPLQGDWYRQGEPDGRRPSDASAKSAYRAIVSGPLVRRYARISETIRGRSSSVRHVSWWYQGDVLVFDCEEVHN